ncbi:GNAT family N-acetyltransferase [Alginatibacterium sediminis]|uniref:GNAT family N-acetyltransferase n=1 Tax=Alginatibacterium sediminis TaxID=2164068 RepID=A0A420EDW4_9ALTE|nr:GNAT family N-acetyltransferase [Alginatibacterium sediminis]RKF18858.1 GNAT family N-acetyltransferase [Alginatibacterium sediminis]
MNKWTIKGYQPERDFLLVCDWLRVRLATSLGLDGFALDRWETQFSVQRMLGRENNSALVFEADKIVGLIVAEGPDEFHFLRTKDVPELFQLMCKWTQERIAKPFCLWSASDNTWETEQLLLQGFVKQANQCCCRSLVLQETLKSIAAPATYQILDVPITEYSWAQQQVKIDNGCFPWANSTVNSVQALLEMPSYRQRFHKGVISENGELVAFSVLWIDTQNQLAVFEPVATLQAHRRKGLAKALMNTLIRQAFDEGVRRFLVGSYSDEAHATYQSVGFTDVNYIDLWRWQT